MRIASSLLSVLVLALAHPTTHARTYEVTHLAGDDSVGSLRWAVAQANARQLDEGNPHVIEFQAGLEGNIELEARIEVTRDLVMHGPGADRITLVGPEHERALYINAVDRFSVTGLRFTRFGPSAHSTGNGGILATVGEMLITYCVFEDCEGERGGAIQCGGNDVFIQGSTFLNCLASDRGGAVFFRAGGAPRGLAVADTTFSGCRARQGGAICGESPLLECSHLTLVNSTGSPLIKLDPSPGQNLKIVNCVVALEHRHQEVFLQEPGVTVTRYGNVFAIKPRLRPLTWYRRSANPSVLPVPYCLPEIDSPVIDAGSEVSGELTFETLHDVRGASRSGRPDAGAVEVRSLTANDATSLENAIRQCNTATDDLFDYLALTADVSLSSPLSALTGQVILTGQDGTDGLIKVGGNDLVRLFTVEAGARVEFENLRLQNGRSTAGGAILNRGFARVSRCWLTTNQAGCGGALRSETGSELEVEACTFSNNVATADSGAVEVFGAKATLRNSSFYKNSANRGGALGFFNTGSSVIFCSFSENSATLDGGAIRIAPDASVTTHGNAFTPHSPSEVANHGIENATHNVTAAADQASMKFEPADWLPFPALYPELDSPFWNATPGSGGRDQTGRLCFDLHRDAGAIEYQTVHPYLSTLSTFSPTEIPPGESLPGPGDRTAPLGDFDGDGQSNYFELYYRGDPFDPDRQAEIKFEVLNINGQSRPSFRFQIDARLDQPTGLRMTRSTDLERWSPIGVSYTSSFEGYHRNILAMDFDSTVVSSIPRAFYRLGLHEAHLPSVLIFLNPVGHPGNLPDGGGLGQVNDRFGMSPYETTNEQYLRFLNAVDGEGGNALNLYDARMSESGGGISVDPGRPFGARYFARSGAWDFPVNYVDYLSALRYCNWLHHGAPTYVASGSRNTILHDGAYTITDPGNLDGVTRKPDARYFLPTHDEWIKGGYFNPAPLTIGGSLYYDYPVQSNSVNNLAAPGNIESANYAGPGFVIPILRATGSYTARSPWGLYDMGGNIAEMIEHSPAHNSPGTTWAKGGSFVSTTDDDLIRNRVRDVSFANKSASVGFRVAGRP